MPKHCLHITLILMFLFLGAMNTLSAQSYEEEAYLDAPIKQQNFQEDAWKKNVENIDYSTLTVKKKKKERARSTQQGSSGRNNRSSSGSSWNFPTMEIGSGAVGAFFKFLLILVLIILGAFLVMRMAGGDISFGRRDFQPNSDAVTNLDIEEVAVNLHKSDLEVLIDKTLAQGNYMLAVRLYYLSVIKELSKRQDIRWKRDKTNRDYIRELRSTPLQSPFRAVTRIFERVWYGQNDISAQEFEAIRPTFQGFIDQLKAR